MGRREPSVTKKCRYGRQYRADRWQPQRPGRGFLPRIPFLAKISAALQQGVGSMADTFFPEFDKSEWTCEVLDEGTYKDINFKMCRYDRIVK